MPSQAINDEHQRHKSVNEPLPVTDLDLTAEECDWIRTWLARRGISDPTPADVAEALWAQHAYIEAMAAYETFQRVH